MKLKWLIMVIAGWGLWCGLTRTPVLAYVSCCTPQNLPNLEPGCNTLAGCQDDVQGCCYPVDCKRDGTSVDMAKCGTANNICCRSASCSAPAQCNSGTIPMWGWCRASSCLATANPVEIGCFYNYNYQYDLCNAGDSCRDSPYLYPAFCADSGCEVGGSVYKTCCNANGTVAACTGGDFSGVCPAGSTPVIGVGPDVCTGGPTSTPGGPTPTTGACEHDNCNTSDAGTCYSWAGSGCNWCSGSNSCVCGACPTSAPSCPAGEAMCYNSGACCRSVASVADNSCSCYDCTDSPLANCSTACDQCHRYADLDVTCCSNNNGVVAHYENLNHSTCGRSVGCGGTVSFDGRVSGFDNYWLTVTRAQVLVDGQILESVASGTDWTFHLSHTFSSAGTYPVTVRVELKEYGAGSDAKCGLRWKTVLGDTVMVETCPVNTPIPTPLLDPPKSVAASCTDPNGPVTVSWGDASNEYKYVILRNVNGGDPSTIYGTVGQNILSFTDPDTGYNKYTNSFGYKVRTCRDNGCADYIDSSPVATVSCPVNVSCVNPSRSPGGSLVSGTSVNYSRGTVGGQYTRTENRRRYFVGTTPMSGVVIGVNEVGSTHWVDATLGDSLDLFTNVMFGYTNVGGISVTCTCNGSNNTWQCTDGGSGPYGNATGCSNTCKIAGIPVVTPTPIPTGAIVGCSGATGGSVATEGQNYSYSPGTITGNGWSVSSKYQYSAGGSPIACTGAFASCSHTVPAAGYTTLSSWTDVSHIIDGKNYVCQGSNGLWSSPNGAPNAQSSCTNDCRKTVPVATPVPGCNVCSSPFCGDPNGVVGCSDCSDSDAGSPAKVNPTFGSIDPSNPQLLNYPSDVTLTWERSTDVKADYYEVGVWDSVGNRVGGIMLINDLNTVSKLMAQSNFVESEVYHWHIKVKNNTCSPEGDSDWSQPPRYFVERWRTAVWAACSGASGAPQPAIVGDQFTYNSGNVTSSGGETRTMKYSYDGGVASACAPGTSCTKTVTNGTNLSFWTDVVIGSNTCQGANIDGWTPEAPNNNPESTCVNSCRVVSVLVVTPTPRPTDSVDCSVCSPLCGQSRETGCIDCSDSDGLIPEIPTLVSPIGSQLTPVAYDSPVTIPLVWNAVSDGLTDKYWVGVWDESGTLIDSTTTALTNYSTLGSLYTAGQTYHWQVNAINDTCPVAKSGGLSASGWFMINVVVGPPGNLPPQLNGLTIKNASGATVAVEGGSVGNKNHICDSRFGGNRNVTFVAQISDPDGNADLVSATLKWNGRTYGMTINQTAGTATTTIDFTGINDSGTYPLEVNVMDWDEASNNWLPVYRSFKSWDCQVAVSGTLYDGSDAAFGIPSCGNPGSGFVKPIEIGYSLTYVPNKAMTVNTPNYSGGGEKLDWNTSYSPRFDGLNEVSPTMRLGTQCNTSFSPSGWLDAYVASPSMIIDFSAVLNQDSWYQVVGGGVRAKTSISDRIPVTCSANAVACSPAISVGTNLMDEGLVAAGTINKGCPDCLYGAVNNKFKTTDLMGGKQYGYSFFSDSLAGRVVGVGTSLSQVLATGATGVVLVNGNLTIDTSNNVPTGEFFMVVASGEITFVPEVTNNEGIFVADGNINIGGTNSQALTISGVVHSTFLGGQIKIERSFDQAGVNNITPAVVFKYRPDFIFNMPPKLSRLISGWGYN